MSQWKPKTTNDKKKTTITAHNRPANNDDGDDDLQFNRLFCDHLYEKSNQSVEC